MDSALCVLARTGFDGLDLQAVAEETGSGKATVHAHFGSREQLFADNSELTELRNRLTKQVRTVPSQPWVKVLSTRSTPTETVS
ncbi:helix-turn-helix domain-containing protein [Nocardia abscessus]|uniref:helix-turn-helix domain-containing protein n=1 Tax=Nocardia abscessus TaxID=120957 RepID=UPI003CC7EBB5